MKKSKIQSYAVALLLSCGTLLSAQSSFAEFKEKAEGQMNRKEYQAALETWQSALDASDASDSNREWTYRRIANLYAWNLGENDFKSAAEQLLAASGLASLKPAQKATLVHDAAGFLAREKTPDRVRILTMLDPLSKDDSVPENVRTSILIMMANVIQPEDRDRANSFLEDAVKLQGTVDSRNVARMTLGNFRTKQDPPQFDEAIQLIQQVLDDPENKTPYKALAMTELARIYRTTKQQEKALDTLDKILELPDLDVNGIANASLEKASYQLAANDYKNAFVTLKKLLQTPNLPERNKKEALNRIIYNCLMTAINSKDPDIDWIDSEIMPLADDATMTDDAKLNLYDRLISLFYAKQPEKAQEFVDKIQALNVDAAQKVRPFLSLAYLQSREKNPDVDSVISLYEKALAAPGLSDDIKGKTYIDMAKILSSAKPPRAEEARAALSKCLQLEKLAQAEKIRASLDLADILLRDPNTKREQIFEILNPLKQDPKLTGNQRIWIFQRLSNALYGCEGKADRQSFETFFQELNAIPNPDQTLLAFIAEREGSYLLSMKEYDAAIRAYSKLTDQFDNEQTRRTVAGCQAGVFEAMEDYEGAVGAYKQAGNWNRAAFCLKKLGRNAEAEQLLQENSSK